VGFGPWQLDSKYDPELERQARDWISQVTGEAFPAGAFQAALKNGVLLCKVANKLRAGAVPKVNTNNMPFMQARATYTHALTRARTRTLTSAWGGAAPRWKTSTTFSTFATRLV
jgi:hypothetical protein